MFDWGAGASPEPFVELRVRPRPDPFQGQAVTRPRVPAYPRPNGTCDKAVRSGLARINRDCLTGALGAALLMAFLTTGWRNVEVLGLRYAGCSEDLATGRLSHHRCAGGGGGEPGALPLAASEVILHYLVLAEERLLTNGAPA